MHIGRAAWVCHNHRTQSCSDPHPITITIPSTSNQMLDEWSRNFSIIDQSSASGFLIFFFLFFLAFAVVVVVGLLLPVSHDIFTCYVLRGGRLQRRKKKSQEEGARHTQFIITWWRPCSRGLKKKSFIFLIYICAAKVSKRCGDEKSIGAGLSQDLPPSASFFLKPFWPDTPHRPYWVM